MTLLHALAAEAGIARLWTDADGVERQVANASLVAILEALGLPAQDEAAAADSLKALRLSQTALPPLLTADCNSPIDLPLALRGHETRLYDEENTLIPGNWREGISVPGYYRISSPNGEVTIAVAPSQCPAIARHCWGVAIQIPSLVGSGRDFGDFGLLLDAVQRLGRAGADAVAISPVHAQFLREPGRFAPYSPSSRSRINALLAIAAEPSGTGQGQQVDWTIAGPAKLAALRRALPSDMADNEVHRLLEKQASDDLGQVQKAARDAGMAIGIITDLAVGVDPGGSDVADDPAAFLSGLCIGAPPDPLGPQGQDWGLTTYSPQALIARRFSPFIKLLRANMPQGGGMRIDHAFGLQRLWVIPEGGAPGDGAYLTYPFQDLLRLIRLEAWRADAIIIAEDLGTRPQGFSKALKMAGILGMAVLPFSREENGTFTPAAEYPSMSVAMSGTHDTPTLAGWWTGRDLEWNRRLNRGGDTNMERRRGRAALWDAIGAGAPQPSNDDMSPVVDRALDFLADTPAPLMLVPMEDLAGLTEQPNLPGTIDEHPNWRRRLPSPMEVLLERPEIAQRIERLNRKRGR